MVSTLSLEPFLARGNVHIGKRLESFTRGLEQIQSLLEYQPIYLVLPDIESELAEQRAPDGARLRLGDRRARAAQLPVRQRRRAGPQAGPEAQRPEPGLGGGRGAACWPSTGR